jgi:invasion protein IalB
MYVIYITKQILCSVTKGKVMLLIRSIMAQQQTSFMILSHVDPLLGDWAAACKQQQRNNVFCAVR